MTSLKRLFSLCGLTTILAVAGGCSDYTYFNVGVYLRMSGDGAIGLHSQQSIGGCWISVFADGKQIEKQNLLTNNGESVCKPGLTDGPSKDLPDYEGGVKTLDLGVLDYSTARQSGSIKFVVTAKDETGESEIAQGVAEGAVSPGKVLEVPLVLSLCSGGCKEKDIK